MRRAVHRKRKQEEAKPDVIYGTRFYIPVMFELLVRISILFFLIPVTSATQPPELTSSLDTRAACTGENVTFTCNVLSDSGRLTWFIGSRDNVIAFSLLENMSSLSTARTDSTGQFTASLTAYSRDQEHSFVGNLTSALHVHIRPSLADFPLIISCSDGISNVTTSSISHAEPPFSPRNVSSILTHGIGEYSVMVQWQTPTYDGGVEIDNYTLTLYHDDMAILQITTTDTVESVHSLNYSTNYSVVISAGNCAGANETVLHIMEAGCVAPSAPVNGSIEEYVSTEEGAEIQFSCHSGYYPTELNISQCLSSTWSPVPQELQCILLDPSICNPEDLKIDLPCDCNWSDKMVTSDGLSLFISRAVNVTFTALSNGSVATYTTTGEYRVNGEKTFQSICQNAVWEPAAVITIQNCSLLDLSPSLVEMNRVCGSLSGGWVCYSGDSVGSVAVYFCDDGYTLQGDTTRECLPSGLWNGTTPLCTETDCSSEKTTAVIVGVVCSVVFLSVGVLLGLVSVYLTLRVRLSGSTSSSKPSPPATYEEVGVAREVKRSHDIQLTSTEDNITTSHNTAYGHVEL